MVKKREKAAIAIKFYYSQATPTDPCLQGRWARIGSANASGS